MSKGIIATVEYEPGKRIIGESHMASWMDCQGHNMKIYFVKQVVYSDGTTVDTIEFHSKKTMK